MQQQKLRLISFDLDDTLYDNKPVILGAFATLYQHLVQLYPALAELYSLEGFIRHSEQFRLDRPDIIDLEQLRHLQIKSILEEIGAQDANTETAYQAFYAARQKVQLHPHATSLLEVLVRKYSLISITNGNANPENFGLGSYFQLNLNPANTGMAKPDPSLYKHACNLMQVKPEQMLHIGNEIDNDYWAAKNAGAHAIWLNLNQERVAGVTQVGSLQELYELVNQSSLEDLL